jgi:hypothetical protein
VLTTGFHPSARPDRTFVVGCLADLPTRRGCCRAARPHRRSAAARAVAQLVRRRLALGFHHPRAPLASSRCVVFRRSLRRPASARMLRAVFRPGSSCDPHTPAPSYRPSRMPPDGAMVEAA